MTGKKACAPVETMSLRLSQQVALWPELKVEQELLKELAQWERDMTYTYAMAPSLKKPLLEEGIIPQEEYTVANVEFGGFVRNHQLHELAELDEICRQCESSLQDYTVRSIGIGQGHDLEGLVTAKAVFHTRIAIYDWAIAALENGQSVLETLFRAKGIMHEAPKSVLFRAEIEQLLGQDATTTSWPSGEGQLTQVEAKETILISISRVLQHMPKKRVIRVLRGLGRIIAMNPMCRVIIVHPYPEDVLNQPVADKYRTAFPYTLAFFLRYISEGAGKPCAELRRSVYDYMQWQRYSASTIGLQQNNLP